MAGLHWRIGSVLFYSLRSPSQRPVIGWQKIINDTRLTKVIWRWMGPKPSFADKRIETFESNLHTKPRIYLKLGTSMQMSYEMRCDFATQFNAVQTEFAKSEKLEQKCVGMKVDNGTHLYRNERMFSDCRWCVSTYPLSPPPPAPRPLPLSSLM